MKTAILQCLEQFSSKNSKVKITVLFQNCGKRWFWPLKKTFSENRFFALFAAVFQ